MALPARKSRSPRPLPGISVNLAHGGTPSSAPPECDAGTARVSLDGSRIGVALEGTDILIADAGTLHDIARVAFGQRYSTGEPYTPWPMESHWSPDGRTLLVGNYGETGSSSANWILCARPDDHDVDARVHGPMRCG